MKQFLAFCEDADGATALRKEHLAAHLDYVAQIVDRIEVAGPLREDAASEIGASCFVYRATTLTEARSLLENDPYHAAGIYARVRWFEFNPAAGRWVGGINWR